MKLAVTSKQFIKFLEFLGFKVIRTKEAPVRLKSDDGRLLRKIIREDLEISLEDFLNLFNKFKVNPPKL